MQYLKMGLFGAIIAVALACGGHSSHNHNHKGHDHGGTHSESVKLAGKEFTSAYVCPMHCEGSGSDEPGVCPSCGMDYERHEDHITDGHTH